MITDKIKRNQVDRCKDDRTDGNGFISFFVIVMSGIKSGCFNYANITM